MSSSCGVGFSENSDSKLAGIEAAKSAFDRLGSASADLIWIFQTGKHDPNSFRDGVRSVVGAKTPLFGGYAAGLIANGKLGYEGFQTGVVAFKFDKAGFDIYLENGLKTKGEQSVGRGLGSQISAKNYAGDPGLIYMFDSVREFRGQGDFDMNIGTTLIEGMSETIGQWPTAAGCGMLGSIGFSPTRQFFNDQIVDQAALATVFHGPGFRMDTTIFHGCLPASDYHTITKAEKNVVLEIDGQPALEKVAEMLGSGSDTSWEQYPLFITLGVNRGDKYDDFCEENYASRLCMAIDKERKGLVMFEPDLVAGTEVQLMRRNIDFDQMQQKTKDLLKRLDGRKPFLAVYIDCIGRAAAFSGSNEEEAHSIQTVLEKQVPMIGIYSGIEIGQVGSIAQQPLDWSGVLCILSEE